MNPTCTTCGAKIANIGAGIAECPKCGEIWDRCSSEKLLDIEGDSCRQCDRRSEHGEGGATPCNIPAAIADVSALKAEARELLKSDLGPVNKPETWAKLARALELLYELAKE